MSRNINNNLRALLVTNVKQCVYCGWNKYIQILEIHHKDLDHENDTLENLVVLCPICHRLAHYSESKWRDVEYVKQYDRERYKLRRKRVLLTHRKYYLKNKEKIKAYNRDRYRIQKECE